MSKKISRREAMSTIGMIGAGTVLMPLNSMAEGMISPFVEGGVAGMENPVTKYPRPPFVYKGQEFPGLASLMDPLPDHGEKSYKGSGRLKGRKALITGGDSGIGRAAAIAFAREGADVMINYLPVEEPDAKEVMQYVKEAGTKGYSYPGDLRQEKFCNQLIAHAIKEMGGVDILVLNAARQKSIESIVDITTEHFDDVFKTNVYANFWLTKAAVPHLRPGSSIIVTISEQADNPSPDLVDYAQTRAAMANFALSMAKQLGPKGIRVNAVNPGPIWTPLQISGGCPPAKIETFGDWTSLGRPGQPAELGSIYVQLADNSASYSTGQTYGACGGTGKP